MSSDPHLILVYLLYRFITTHDIPKNYNTDREWIVKISHCGPSNSLHYTKIQNHKRIMSHYINHTTLQQ